MADYIPANDDAFNDWQLNFGNWALGNGLGFGIAQAELDELDDLMTEWATRLSRYPRWLVHSEG